MNISTADMLVLAGQAVLLLAMISVGAILSARMRRTARELQKVVASTRYVPAAPIPAPALARPSGPFLERQQEVYAGLYARYRRAAESAMPRPDRAPDFTSFSRDELLRYLARRKVRERDAKDAIAALDRGDTFAMTRLMGRLHEKVNQRDASLALERATHFEEIHELYLSDPVRAALAVLRERLTPEAAAQPGGERRSQNAGPLRAAEHEVRDALASVQRAMREELGGEHPAPVTSRPPLTAAPAEQSLVRDVHREGARPAQGTPVALSAPHQAPAPSRASSRGTPLPPPPADPRSPGSRLDARAL